MYQKRCIHSFHSNAEKRRIVVIIMIMIKESKDEECNTHERKNKILQLTTRFIFITEQLCWGCVWASFEEPAWLGLTFVLCCKIICSGPQNTRSWREAATIVSTNAAEPLHCSSSKKIGAEKENVSFLLCPSCIYCCDFRLLHHQSQMKRKKKSREMRSFLLFKLCMYK